MASLLEERRVGASDLLELHCPESRSAFRGRRSRRRAQIGKGSMTVPRAWPKATLTVSPELDDGAVSDDEVAVQEAGHLPRSGAVDRVGGATVAAPPSSSSSRRHSSRRVVAEPDAVDPRRVPVEGRAPDPDAPGGERCAAPRSPGWPPHPVPGRRAARHHPQASPLTDGEVVMAVVSPRRRPWRSTRSPGLSSRPA